MCSLSVSRSSPAVPGNEQRADLGADEVIGATGAEEGELLGVGRVDELEHIGASVKLRDPALLRADCAAQEGADLDGERCARSARAGTGFAAEARVALGDSVAMNELADLVDDGEGVQIALALRLAPGEEAVAAEHDAVAAGILAYDACASS